MKGIYIITTIVWCSVFIACEKQNAYLPKEVQPVLQRSDDYFANLRAYKKTDHPIYFGWFGGTGAAGDPQSPTIIEQIPDSVDIVSLWGGWPPIDSYGFKAMQRIRSQKGTKFLWVMFGSGVQNLIKQNDSALFVNDVMTAIDNVAKAMADTINKYQLDGFDLDYEPAFGDNSIFGDSGGNATNDPHTQRLFKALSQYMGPKSGTDNVLIVDGQSDIGIVPYINYFMQQAYGATSGSNLQSRITTYGGSGFPVNKFVPCESFEAYAATGGVNFTDPVRGTVPSMLGFAYWNPAAGRKGGVGAYHAEYDYGNNPDYKYVRQAIQIMNPAAK